MAVPVPTKLSTMGEAEIDNLRVPAKSDRFSSIAMLYSSGLLVFPLFFL